MTPKQADKLIAAGLPVTVHNPRFRETMTLTTETETTMPRFPITATSRDGLLLVKDTIEAPTLEGAYNRFQELHYDKLEESDYVTHDIETAYPNLHKELTRVAQNENLVLVDPSLWPDSVQLSEVNGNTVITLATLEASIAELLAGENDGTDDDVNGFMEELVEGLIPSIMRHDIETEEPGYHVDDNLQVTENDCATKQGIVDCLNELNPIYLKHGGATILKAMAQLLLDTSGSMATHNIGTTLDWMADIDW